MNSEELKDKYKHFSIRNFPFQDTIIDAIPEKGIPYSDREIWFKHIYLLTSKGYYIQIKSPLEKVPNHIFCLCNLLTINGTFS